VILKKVPGQLLRFFGQNGANFFIYILDDTLHCLCRRQWRTQKIFMGGFHSVAYGVICLWCTVFVTSQFDVIFMFPNQRFGEVC